MIVKLKKMIVVNKINKADSINEVISNKYYFYEIIQKILALGFIDYLFLNGFIVI